MFTIYLYKAALHLCLRRKCHSTQNDFRESLRFLSPRDFNDAEIFCVYTDIICSYKNKC